MDLRFGVIGVGRLGSAHARILGELPGIELVGVHDSDQDRARIEPFGPVDDISLLDGCAAVHVLVSLEMPPGSPGEAWDPPVVERVELRWSLRPGLSPGANQAQRSIQPDQAGAAVANPGPRD